jgi:hypothetical protein
LMTTWTEANFLERLRAPLKDAYDASASLCPDAEMMSAYAHNTANEFVRNAVEKHLRTCADCRELAAQLAEFDAAGEDAVAMSAAMQAEWVNAEKRLDIASDNFVRTAEVDFRKAARVEPAPAASTAHEAAWQFPWVKSAWSVAAVALLVVLGFVLMRHEDSVIRHETADMEAEHVSPPSSAAPNATTSSAATPVTNGGAKQPPPIAVANETGSNGALPSAVRDAEGATIVAEPPATHGKPRSTAGHVPAKHAAPEVGPVVASNGATDTGATAAPPAPDTNANSTPSSSGSAPPSSSEPNAVASNVAPPPTAATPGPATSTSGSHGGGSLHGFNSFGSHNTSAAATRPKSAAPDAPLPQSIQLSAGTRVWIVYRNITHRSDSSFAFTGSLLEPISGTGSTPLGKDTEIDGEGVAVNGKTSLTVEQIVIRGVRYQLKGSGGAVTQGSAGGGAAITFDSGQVQELWVAGPATYEKAGDTGASGSKP